MKNAMKFLTIILLWSLAIPLKAQTTNKFDLSVKGNNKVHVELTNSNENYSVFISDANGLNIYEANDLNIGSLKFTVDLTNQKQGLYQITVRDDVKMQSIPFILGTESITLNKSQSKTSYFPQFEKEGNLILVKMISSEENDMQLNIVNDEGERLYYEQIGGQVGMIGKRFKFEPGAYVFTLNSNDYHYQKVLNIK